MSTKPDTDFNEVREVFAKLKTIFRGYKNKNKKERVQLTIIQFIRWLGTNLPQKLWGSLPQNCYLKEDFDRVFEIVQNRSKDNIPDEWTVISSEESGNDIPTYWEFISMVEKGFLDELVRTLESKKVRCLSVKELTYVIESTDISLVDLIPGARRVSVHDSSDPYL